MMLSNRSFHGEEFYKFCVKEYELIRQKRKAFKGKPDEYDKLEISLDRLFEKFYGKVLD